MLQNIEDENSYLPASQIRPTSKRPRSNKNKLLVQKSVKTSLDVSTIPEQPPEQK